MILAMKIPAECFITLLTLHLSSCGNTSSNRAKMPFIPTIPPPANAPTILGISLSGNSSTISTQIDAAINPSSDDASNDENIFKNATDEDLSTLETVDSDLELITTEYSVDTKADNEFVDNGVDELENSASDAEVTNYSAQISTEGDVVPATVSDSRDEVTDGLTVAAYGTWSSPVSSDMVFKTRNNIIEPPKVDPVSGHVFWVEEVASEDGHGVLYQYNTETKTVERWSGRSVDVRTRVHEYGGGSFVLYNNSVIYSDATTNRLYLQVGSSGEPVAITSSSDKRYADGSYSPKTNKVYFVCEDHGPVKSGESAEPKNSIVVFELSKGFKESTMVPHADFFSSPRITEDGTKLVWVQWNHPNMPWDETKLYIANVHPNNTLAFQHYFQNPSMMMPSWNQHNELLYVHEMTNWWNLYIIKRNGAELNLTPEKVEVGWPMWHLGQQAYDTSPAVGGHEAVVITGKELRVVNTRTGSSRILDTGYDVYQGSVAYSKDGRKVYTIASDGKRFTSVVEVDLVSGKATPLRSHLNEPIDEKYISLPKLIQFPTSDEMFAYGYFYAPTNPKFVAPPETAPPLVVVTHQGPTLAASRSLSLLYQYYTSRGFAILDVDHRGSTGYGKYYRNLLRGKWGVYELADLVAGAQKLVSDGLVDQNLLFITGTSAGGFAALSAITFTDSFTAGSCQSGISDLLLLYKTAHKFESRYLKSLIGNPVSDKHLFEERSPINSADNITTPIIFFHGVLDKVTPISQAERMYSVLKSKGIPTALIRFEDEHHGISIGRNKRYALDTEIDFFSKVGNFTLGEVTSDVSNYCI